MKTIKKWWVAIVAGIAAVFSIFVLVSNRQKKNKVEKIDNAIKQNDADINIAQGHIEEIQDQRDEKIEDIKQAESEIADLKQQAEEVKPEVREVEAAKENILKKTRRGRSKKS